MAVGDRTLKRLLRRKGLSKLVDDLIERSGNGLVVTDAAGQVVLGNASQISDASAEIQADGRLIGHVHGDDARHLADVLSLLAEQNAENRALARDSLEKYKEITMLYDVSERILASPDAQQVAALVCEEAERFLRGDSITVLLLNEETGRLELIASSGLAYHSRSSMEVGDDLIGTVLQSGNGEIVNDMHADPRSIAADNALRSVVCSPMKSKNRVFGVVVVGSTIQRQFNASDLQLLNALSFQAAAAIEVARLYSVLKLTSEKPADLIYGVNERPPAGVLGALGLQHVIIALMSLAYPVLITLEAGGSRSQAASVVSMSLIAMGIATLLQVCRKGPVGSGYLAPHITSAIYLAPSLLAARSGGLGLVFGMTLFVGGFGILFSQLVGRFRKLFPPEVCGIVVLMVGLSMIRVAFSRFLGLDGDDAVSEPVEWTVGLITIGTIIALTVFSPGRIRIYAAIIGIAVGYVAAAVLGVLDRGAFDPLIDLPLVGIPARPSFELAFAPALVFPFLAAVLASDIKNVGLITSCQKTNDGHWKRPDTKSISGGIVADSIGNLSAGLLGGVGTGVSAGGVGLAAASGATSRTIGMVTGLMFVALAFMPKLTAVLALMPLPVIGAGLIYVACYLITSGTQLIVSRLLDSRRTFIVGLSVLAGVGVDIMPEAFQDAPDWAAAFLGSPLAISTILAVGLNLVLNIGVSSKARLTLALGDQMQDRIFRFFQTQGAAWGARADVIGRAAPAVTEWCEEIKQIARDANATIDLQFDEFHLVIDVAWSADNPGNREEHTLDPIAGYLQRRYDCRFRQSGSVDTGNARFDFEH
jgi:NCS2 family nucleobase:cation symporter-2